ncbi:MAG TPA: hypothetical protein VNR70_13045 [Steroidobacteraceae bacterium]|nr:hypothetical protein [Steroidobacteraceae bacterium]
MSRTLGTAAATVVMLVSLVGVASADLSLPPVTVGAGIQTSFYNCDKACIYSPGTIPAGDSSVSGFALDSVRLYINGSVTDQIKIMFNTEYTGSGAGENKVGVLDAVGRFEFSDHVNIWAGRFLPPSDRANLYGPYYANDWAPFADGVADFYPSVATGRDNGVAYWGQFGILKLSAGVFDGGSLNSAVTDKSKLLYAARAQLDFWDKEGGYYLNGTYYGEKDLLALGLAAQSQDSKTTVSLDGLMEKKLPNAGVVTVEAEYMHDNGLSGLTTSKGWYGLGAYLFPQAIGIGKIQLLAKYSQKTIDSGFENDTTVAADKLKTFEFNANYIIKTFNARVGLYFLHQKDDIGNFSPHEIGLKLQLQI